MPAQCQYYISLSNTLNGLIYKSLIISANPLLRQSSISISQPSCLRHGVESMMTAEELGCRKRQYHFSSGRRATRLIRPIVNADTTNG
ncbi:hypothetical protein RSOLAG1IB_05728 [Rhizoctonia solani AG-1 IB]|uniref:Uncharacterized protein n=1 Tax=Thanatephorus cucumeris (strain AG1-IB / isolate 7/3/14) TaxID=1108050 RepID=A0A0B7F6H9_THACB|nr:hypothetical protein RSOLAG1IB_05728 [Rhizoctonia solani AG-1 IB]